LQPSKPSGKPKAATIEAAISAYLQRQGLTTFDGMATRKRATLAATTARPA